MKKLIFFILFLFCVEAHAAENVALTTPIDPDPASYDVLQIAELNFSWRDSTITVIFYDPDHPKRNAKTCLYEGQTAKNLMISLNKTNLTSNSLFKRIINQAISSGCIAGSQGGTTE